METCFLYSINNVDKKNAYKVAFTVKCNCGILVLQYII